MCERVRVRVHSRPRGFPFFVGWRAVEQPCAVLASSVAHRRDDDTVAPLRHSDVTVTGAGRTE